MDQKQIINFMWPYTMYCIYYLASEHEIWSKSARTYVTIIFPNVLININTVKLDFGSDQNRSCIGQHQKVYLENIMSNYSILYQPLKMKFLRNETNIYKYP